MPLSIEQVTAAVATVSEPVTKKSLSELRAVTDVSLDGTNVRLTVELPKGGTAANTPHRAELGAKVREAVEKLEGVTGVEIRWREELAPRAIAPDDPVPEVKNIILVMSGKGGVGKSTVATNVSMALHRAGFRVGLLDADIYGPSIPTMLGVEGRPVSQDGKTIEPLERFGVKLMSIGLLLEDPRAAVVWRGPMLHGALLQFLKDVHWGALD
jgi:ATP-binding protein involved in chromosome partitioning